MPITPRKLLEGKHCLSSRKTEAYDDEQTMIVVISLISEAHTIIRYHRHLSFSVPFRKKEKKRRTIQGAVAQNPPKKKTKVKREQQERVHAGSGRKQTNKKKRRGKENKIK